MCTSLFGDTSDTTSSGLAQRLGMYPQLVLLPARWDPLLHVLGRMTSEVKVFILGTTNCLITIGSRPLSFGSFYGTHLPVPVSAVSVSWSQGTFGSSHDFLGSLLESTS